MKKRAITLFMAALTAASTLGTAGLPVLAETVTIDVGTFTNIYTPTAATLTIPASKVLNVNGGSDKSLAANDYSFTLTEYTDDTYKTVAQDSDKKDIVYTAKNAVGTKDTDENKYTGTITFTGLSYSTTGKHYYIVRETAGSDTSHVVYDSKEYKVVVDVTGSNGVLTAKATDTEGKDITESSITFTNTYTPASASVQFKGKKAITDASGSGMNTTLAANKFEFKLYDSTGTVKGTATNDENGNITFSNLTFDSCGTYTYTVAEVKGNEVNWKYDGNYHTVQFKVTDVNGQLTVTQQNADGDNKVKVSDSEPAAVKKVHEGTQVSGAKQQKTFESDDADNE